tara:strand:+ start:2075 stop:2200 length:126 start_codon:yes stop_codon:yes gene_type:complete
MYIDVFEDFMARESSVSDNKGAPRSKCYFFKYFENTAAREE